MGNTKSTNQDEETDSSANCDETPTKRTNNSSSDLRKKNGETSRSTTSLEAKSKIPVLTSNQRQIVKFCMENAKEDLGERIFRRVGDKREDFRVFTDKLTKTERLELVEGLRQFVLKVNEVIADPEELDAIGRSFGERHAHLRSLGFKPDYFVTFADSITTECVFLDGATHTASETLLAWSQLTSVLFTSVRTGYYAELRRLRRLSNSTTSSAKEVEEPISAETQRDDHGSNEDDRISSKSTESSHEESGPQIPHGKSEPAQFLAPPSAF